MKFLHYLPMLAVALIWGERLREVLAKRDTVPGHRREVVTFTLFMLSGALMFAGGILEYWWCGGFLRWPALVVGAAFSVTSFIIRRRTIAALGKFWSLHVEMRTGHEFVQSGPFRWMRHPVYFSMILELIGPALILSAWRTLAVVAVIFIPTMIWRVRLEEAALVETFGAAYEAYRHETPMIVPWRGPRAS